MISISEILNVLQQNFVALQNKNRKQHSNWKKKQKQENLGL